MGEFLRDASARLDDPDFEAWAREECAVDGRAAANLHTFLSEQREAAGELQSDRLVVVEEFDDELGDRRVVIHSPFGARVHHAWLLAFRARVREAENLDVEGVAVDDGIMLRFPGRDSPAPIDLAVDLPDDEELDELLLRELQISPLFGILFRESAARALLLPRRGPGRRTPLWLQRIRSQDLMQLVKRYGEFPILLEAYREAWDDLLRVRDFRKVADGLRSGEIAVHRITPDIPTPFAMHFLFDYNMAFQYVGDYPRAEWRSQLLAVDRDLLARVVRPDALRDLLDERAITRVEGLLQRMDDRSRPRTPDELADALSALGDLSDDEVRARVGARWRSMIDALVADGRAVRADVGGERRWIAAELADEYGGLPGTIQTVVRRHLAGRGPVTAAEVAARYGVDEGAGASALLELQAGGEVSTGEFRPGGSEREWVDTDNLRRIHRETLQMLRSDVQPADPERFAELLLSRRRSPPGVEPARRVLDSLAGLPVPAASLVPEILASRFRDGDVSGVEDVLRSGEFLWQGLPGRRVALLPRERSERFLRPPAEVTDEAALAVEEVLRARGASFLAEVVRETGIPEQDALKALFQLVWAGRVTNDTLAGLEEPRGKDARRRRSRPPLYGRWSLLPEPDEDVADRAEPWAERLLASYGVVSREVAGAAETPVPWPLLVDALTTMEAQGRVRRGYFVRGLSGVQFATSSTVERLRRPAGKAVRAVATADPANPWGPILPVAGDAPYRPVRTPGHWLVVIGGRPVLAAEGGGKRLIPLDAARARRAVSLLRELARGRGKIRVETWGDEPVLGGPGEALLAEAGFARGPRGMAYRPPIR